MVKNQYYIPSQLLKLVTRNFTNEYMMVIIEFENMLKDADNIAQLDAPRAGRYDPPATSIQIRNGTKFVIILC